MINSISSSISGLNANAYATVVRGKPGAGDVSEPRNEPQPESYWTPERMRNAIPPDMGAMQDTEVEGSKPEEAERPEGMVPPDMGTFLKSGVEPNSSNPNSYIENVNGIQLDDYWTPERMRNAIPPDMGALKEPEENSPETEESEQPEGVVPPDMGQLLKSGVEPNSSNPNSYIENVNGIQLDDYWTPERMRNAIPPDMGALKEPEEDKSEPEATQVDLLSQYHHFLLSAIGQQSVNILA